MCSLCAKETILGIFSCWLHEALAVCFTWRGRKWPQSLGPYEHWETAILFLFRVVRVVLSVHM